MGTYHLLQIYSHVFLFRNNDDFDFRRFQFPELFHVILFFVDFVNTFLQTYSLSKSGHNPNLHPNPQILEFFPFSHFNDSDFSLFIPIFIISANLSKYLHINQF